MNQTPNSEPKVNCTLKGQVIDRDSEALVLFKAITADPRRAPKIVIPIENGRFEYQLKEVYIEKYILAFKEEIDKGGFMAIRFFAEEGEVVFQLYPRDRARETSFVGGPVNAELKAYWEYVKKKLGDGSEIVKEKIKELHQAGKYFSKEWNDTYKALIAAEVDEQKDELKSKLDTLRKEKKDLTPEGRKVHETHNAFYLKSLECRNQYIDDHQSYVSYFFLLQSLRSRTFESEYFDNDHFDLERARRQYQKLAEKFPHHPYTPMAKKILDSYTAVKVGGHLVDFIASDLEGRPHRFSALAKDKVVLLDLWATTCGSCIRKSRTVVPVYEDFKNQGFTVISVARAFNNTDRVSEILEKERFPWLTLTELDDEQEIWMKYGIPFSSGATFLIDEKGEIREINPSAGSIRKLLEER